MIALDNKVPKLKNRLQIMFMYNTKVNTDWRYKDVSCSEINNAVAIKYTLGTELDLYIWSPWAQKIAPLPHKHILK